MERKISKRDDLKRLIIFLLISVIIAIHGLFFSYIWYRYYRGMIFEPFWRKGNWVLIAIYIIIEVLFSRLFGGLRVGYHKRLDVFYTLAFTVLSTNVITYFQIVLINRWFLPVAPIIFCTISQLILGLLWVICSRFLYLKIYGAKELLVLYGDRHPFEMVKKIHSRKDRYKVRRIINIDTDDEEIFSLMEQYDGVVIWDLPSGIRNKYLKYCFDHSILCYMSPKISDIIIMGSDRIHLFDTPLLSSKNTGLTFEQRFIKRAFDILVSSIAIIIFSPIMILVALCVYLYDKGPIIYTQERLTLDGKPFKIYKFRSMIVNSEAKGARLAKKNDSRITPIGKIIRNLHLDELPQLFNVFKGDMSLVGPRPERQAIMDEYSKEIPEFKYRLKVKAGLTGYAQVYGKYNTVPYDKLKLDLFYIENYSFLLDIKLLFMTVKIFFQKEVSEGVDNNQKSALKNKKEDVK